MAEGTAADSSYRVRVEMSLRASLRCRSEQWSCIVEMIEVKGNNESRYVNGATESQNR